MVSKSQRQRQLAREKYERQTQRRTVAQQRRHQRNKVIGAALAVVVVAGGAVWGGIALTGDDDKDKTAPVAQEKPRTCAAPEPGEATKEQFATAPEMSIDVKAAYSMDLKTTCGDIKIDLNAEKAPTTVNSFNFLAGKKFFDHTKCHRQVDGPGLFVLQCGDPTASGKGGPGYQFKNENLEGATYPAGTVAMANSGPDTNGSQFFLVYKDSQLPPDYTPFGKISGGMDVLEKIAAGGAEAPDAAGTTAPHENVVLNSVTVSKK